MLATMLLELGDGKIKENCQRLVLSLTCFCKQCFFGNMALLNAAFQNPHFTRRVVTLTECGFVQKVSKVKNGAV